MTDFSFLDNIELTEVQASATRKTKAEANPPDADLRLFADGSLYPSTALTEEFQLEYQEDGSEARENGFDLIDSDLWGMLPKGTPRFLAIATVSKASAPKPMLFGKARKKDGKPTHSVNDQGSTASGTALAEYLKEVLDFEFAEGESFVDLIIDREHLIASPNGVYQLPRTQKKGKEAGKAISERRENCLIYPLTIGSNAVAEAPLEETEVEVEEEAPQE